ncbi:MAG: hypothetical protein M1823_000648 [Watsoniomyces obsoletus]|nr:MAG: hypothetical protein M1823_000648 [Watsoniomyces obsoletus]
MCGRYALALRPSDLRRQLEASGMPVSEWPDDDGTRQSYNVAPGYYEPVYRADVPDTGAGSRPHDRDHAAQNEDDVPAGSSNEQGETPSSNPSQTAKEVRYKLQAMKWGLVPFWTKRNPDYGSLMKTINCRDDSLIENRGMWTTMKQKKRCIVVCQGFYEWLKKHGGKEKVPHFVKRKDGQLMCFAGLWDCVQYEGSNEKLYTYTIITTDSNDQLKFLHDRIPVILENGSEQIRTWLDPNRSTWSAELQSLLKPYKGELEIYPVSKEVGKVGNNSPAFIVPVASSENKQNIANFFANAKGADQKTKAKAPKPEPEPVEAENGQDSENAPKIEHQAGEDRKTIKEEDGTENNAPVPVPNTQKEETKGQKRKHTSDSEDGHVKEEAEPSPKARRVQTPTTKESSAKSGPTASTTRKTRSATSNETAQRAKKSTAKKGNEKGSQKITSFFDK